MRTNELIDTLVADTATRSAPVGRVMTIAGMIGFGLAVLIFATHFGLRADLPAALTTWRFLVKLALPFLLFAAAARLAYTLVIPGRETHHAALGVALAPAFVVLAVLLELSSIPSSAWFARAMGMSSFVCSAVMAGLALPLLASLLIALRHGAPSSPEGAGAAAGLCAGAAAACLYATHCTDDSPLFLALWYTLAIALVTAAGAVAGKLWLKW